MPKLVLGAIVLLASVSCGPHTQASGPAPFPDRPPSELLIAGDGKPTRLFVEIARTEAERAEGLMGRRSLKANQGMVFLFSEPTEAGFWMKDTLIPLSIAFWDSSDRIVAILDMEPCGADPCPAYEPGIPYVGAVEASRGYFDRHGVEVGDAVELG